MNIMKTIQGLSGWAIVALCVLHLIIITIRNTATEKEYLFIIASLLIAFHVRED